MRVYRNIDEIEFNHDTIITVGTFDGVHRGHQLILDKISKEAEELNLRDMVITIHPHPQVVLQKPERDPIQILTSIDERIELFEKFGINNLFVLPFTFEFSQTPPEVFIKDILFGRIGLSKMLIGYDHMFGRNRSGNFDLLNDLSHSLGFTIDKVSAFGENDSIISSTKIRNCLKNHDIKTANSMLGYNYFAKGIVVKGDMRGRTIGYPTANIEFEDNSKLIPAKGVYLVKVNIKSGQFYGMCNIGTRPTFKDDNKVSFEVFIFDFDEDIYGEPIRVEFIDFIRNEMKFEGVANLISALQKDEKFCREIINSF